MIQYTSIYIYVSIIYIYIWRCIGRHPWTSPDSPNLRIHVLDWIGQDLESQNVVRDHWGSAAGFCIKPCPMICMYSHNTSFSWHAGAYIRGIFLWS